jgi:hypothetical protein
MTRHKMLSVSYNWDNETPKITYHANFENYNYVQKVDGLTDVIYDLKIKMEIYSVLVIWSFILGTNTMLIQMI